jgi:hypothetical protein
MAAPATATDPLDEARWICRHRLHGVVWFEPYCFRDPKTYELVTVYRIYRRHMGRGAERSSPAALLAYLRKQLPPS